MALRKQYGALFDKVWDTFDLRYGMKGSKPKAEIEFNKLKLTESDVAELIGIIEEQKRDKAQLRSTGEFWERFQHVERYLKNARFEDERCESGVGLNQEAVLGKSSSLIEAALGSNAGAGRVIEGDYSEAHGLVIDSKGCRRNTLLE